MNLKPAHLDDFKTSGTMGRHYDLNLLNNYTHTYNEARPPVSDISLNKLGRLSLNEMQGYLFNLLVIHKFNTSVPVADMKVTLNSSNDRVYVLSNAKVPSKRVTIYEWMKAAANRYISGELDPILFQLLLDIPDSPSNMKNNI